MTTNHRTTNPPQILKRQKKVMAPDFPIYVISLYECQCGCGGYSVVLTKADIGYTKDLLNIEYNKPLEAFIKFEKLVEECMNGKYDMLHKEDQMFD